MTVQTVTGFNFRYTVLLQGELFSFGSITRIWFVNKNFTWQEMNTLSIPKLQEKASNLDAK